jgi:predicted GIY-YIG superfamily endonuclease
MTWRSDLPELIAQGLRNHFVYQVFNKAGDVIYVGCTRRPEKRWKEHQADPTRRQMVREARRFRMFGPYDYPTARRIEREQQFDLRPKHNAIPITRSRSEAWWISGAKATYLDGGASA